MSHSEGEFDLDLLELREDEESSSSRPRPLVRVVKQLTLRSHMRCVWIPQRNQKTAQIAELFQYLRRKGVVRIMRLEVDEDISQPHSDEVIIHAIKDFEIEELDWKVCPSGIDPYP
jgi:hypothetical protein